MRISAISLRYEAKRVHISSVMNMYTFVNKSTAAYMTFCVHVEQCHQGSLSPSSSAKLVDCILALKSYHEWKQGGALGFWRLKSPSHPMGYITNSGKYITRSKSMNTSSSQGRRKWAIPDLEGLDDRDLLSSPELSVNSLSFDKDSRASFEEMLHNAHAGQNGVGDGDADEVLSNMHMSGSVFIVPYHIINIFIQQNHGTIVVQLHPPLSLTKLNSSYTGPMLAFMHFDVHMCPRQDPISHRVCR